MIALSKLNGDKIYINESWIEAIESLPDTTITLSSGNKFVILEPMPEVLDKILNWQRQTHGLGLKPAGNARKPKSGR